MRPFMVPSLAILAPVRRHHIGLEGLPLCEALQGADWSEVVVQDRDHWAPESRKDRPSVVRSTASSPSTSLRKTATNPFATASSQTGMRGQDVRHASSVSRYVRGRAANHA